MVGVTTTLGLLMKLLTNLLVIVGGRSNNGVRTPLQRPCISLWVAKIEIHEGWSLTVLQGAVNGLGELEIGFLLDCYATELCVSWSRPFFFQILATVSERVGGCVYLLACLHIYVCVCI